MIKLPVCFKVGRLRHSLTAVDGSLVAAGGRDDEYNRFSSSSVEILDETGWSTPSWSLKAPVSSRMIQTHTLRFPPQCG